MLRKMLNLGFRNFKPIFLRMYFFSVATFFLKLDDTGAIITNHKRYLKGLLQENVKGICFSKPKSRRESEVVSSNSTNLVDYFRCIPDEYQLFLAAKTVRNDIINTPKWTFTGEYAGFQAPK